MKNVSRHQPPRYQDAQALAKDLRRHIHDQPLVGVGNHDWAERYLKWRRRRPAALRTLILLTVILGALSSIGMGVVANWRHLASDADYSLLEARRNWKDRHLFDEARANLDKGLDNALAVPGPGKGTSRPAPERAQTSLHEAQAASAALSYWWGCTRWPNRFAPCWGAT